MVKTDVGITDFMDEDVAILKVDGKALVLPKAAGRLDSEQLGALRGMQLVGLKIAELEGDMAERAAEARELGISWALIGFCNQVTGEAVRKRYGSEDVEL